MWEIRDQDEAAIMARYGSIGVAVLRAPIDARFFDRVERFMDELSDEPKFSFLIVRAGEVPGKMPPALRDRARAMVEGHASQLLGFGYVLGGSGLKAKMVRGAMNAVLLGASFPAKTFTSVPDAVGWLLSRPGQPGELTNTQREITRAIETVGASS